MTNFFKLNREDYMSNIKIKFVQLFAVEPGKGLNIQQINPEIEALINLKAKSAQLKYDLQSKLSKAIDKALKEFDELRLKVIKENSHQHEVEFEDGTKETINYVLEPMDEEEYKNLTDEQRKKVIAVVDGTAGPMKIKNAYDVTEDFQPKFNELLNVEIELNCYPIKLSRLNAEEDCSSLNFAALENFIHDDLN